MKSVNLSQVTLYIVTESARVGTTMNTYLFTYSLDHTIVNNIVEVGIHC